LPPTRTVGKQKKALDALKAEYAEYKEASDDANAALQQKVNRSSKLNDVLSNNYKTLDERHGKKKVKIQELEAENEKLRKQLSNNTSKNILPSMTQSRPAKRKLEDESWEESLQITNIPDSENDPKYDGGDLDFDDLDFGYGISSNTGKVDYKGKGRATSSPASAKHTLRDPFADFSNKAGSTAASMKKEANLKPINKWTDMVIQGSSLALGDKKKAKNKF